MAADRHGSASGACLTSPDTGRTQCMSPSSKKHRVNASGSNLPVALGNLPHTSFPRVVVQLSGGNDVKQRVTYINIRSVSRDVCAAMPCIWCISWGLAIARDNALSAFAKATDAVAVPQEARRRNSFHVAAIRVRKASSAIPVCSEPLTQPTRVKTPSSTLFVRSSRGLVYRSTRRVSGILST
jgi:hypothetical protein